MPPALLTPRLVLAALLVTACGPTAELQPPAPEASTPQTTEAERVKAGVRANYAALYAGDVDAVLELTHPRVLEVMGGRANARRVLEPTFEQMRSLGLRLQTLHFPEEPEFLDGEENEFVVVTTDVVVRSGSREVESRNFLLGARARGASDWTYVEGSRLDGDNLELLFPDFPAGHELPSVRRALR